jgi:hypothetical protein
MCIYWELEVSKLCAKYNESTAMKMTDYGLDDHSSVLGRGLGVFLHITFKVALEPFIHLSGEY